MERIIHGSTSTDPLDWNGHHESPGSMTDDTGRPLPAITSNLGRSVTVSRVFRRLGDGPNLEGRLVEIRAFDQLDREISLLRRWIPLSNGDGS